MYYNKKTNKNQGEALHITNFEEIAYHQHEVLHIIKSRDDILAFGEMIYTAPGSAIICQICDLEKQKDERNVRLFLFGVLNMFF